MRTGIYARVVEGLILGIKQKGEQAKDVIKRLALELQDVFRSVGLIRSATPQEKLKATFSNCHLLSAADPGGNVSYLNDNPPISSCYRRGYS